LKFPLGDNVRQNFASLDATYSPPPGSKVMTHLRRKTLKNALLIFFVCFCSIGAFGQTKPGVGVEDVYLAKDNGKGQAGETATVFRTNDIPIYCIVQLDSSTPVTVKMELVAASVAGVKADTKVVSTSYTTKGSENRVNFTGRPEGKWTPGKYRADIFLDGKLSKNLLFEIQDPAPVSGGIRSFQPRKSSRANTKPRKNPYIQSTARVIDR